MADGALEKSSPEVLDLIWSMNPEVSLFISEDLSDHTKNQVEGYFNKVADRCKYAEVISFTNFNELVGRFP